MFNLFGSLFFGNRAPLVAEQPAQQSQVDSSTQTVTTSMHNTDTNNTQNSHELTKTLHTFIGPLNYNETSVANTSLDWVIVDRTEEADKCNQRRADAAMNTSTSHLKERLQQEQTSSDANNEQGDDDDDQNMQQNEVDEQQVNHEEEEDTRTKMFERADDDHDIILGSFFEKNETDSAEDSRRYKITNDNDDDRDDQVVMMQHEQAQKQQQDWQITPLPCLTSTVTSQRSLVDEDPLENLLIEHPSMSVFVSATSSSSSSSSSNSPVSKKKCEALIEEENENQDEYDYMLSMLFSTAESSSAQNIIKNCTQKN